MFSKLFSYSWIKENLSMVILIPTVFGGIWQIIELCLIGTPYIRFFSVSQLVSDGLLLAFIFFWVIIIFKFCSFTLFRNVKDVEMQPDIVDNTRKKQIWRRIGILIALLFQSFFIIFQSYLLLEFAPNIFKTEQTSFLTIIISEMTILMIIVMAIYAFVNLINLFKKVPNFSLKFTNPAKALNVFLYTISIFFILFSFYTFPLFHKSFSLSNNFKNMEYVGCLLNKENINLKSFKVLYFNDKYIFFEIVEKSKKRYIEVKKFEIFLENPCN